MRGDLLFFPSSGSLPDRIIASVTRGPFVHVAVDLGDGTDISAQPIGGVKVRPTIHSKPLTRLAIRGDIERGITFLQGELGNPYGYCNVLNAGLQRLGLPYRVSRLDRYDCSSLVARYLERVGIFLGDLSEEPDSVSPNDLARALGVLK